MNQNSEIILVKNIKMDKNYKNVLSYNENDMVNLCRTNKVIEQKGYSFLRPNENIINVGIPYATCVQANYIAFQNPYYSNKWFFAFIDHVVYISENATRIEYTIDEWSTWWGYWVPDSCYVLREHTNNDTIGFNTVNENVDLGDFICMKEDNPIYVGSIICVALSDIVGILVDEYTNIPDVHNYNGIASGLVYIALSSSNFEIFMKIVTSSGKSDFINNIFMIPGNFTSGATFRKDYRDRFEFAYLPETDTFYNCGEIPLLIQKDTIGEKGYIPKNKKLFTYPYFFLEATNNCGTNVVYRYEDFSPLYDFPPGNPNNNYIKFVLKGSISSGCSIRCIPNNYKIPPIPDSTDYVENYNEGFNLGKLPVCSWITDPYNVWLRQNSLNNNLQILDNTIQIASGAISKNPGQIISGGLNMVQDINTYYQMSLTPRQARGNTNSSDINFATNHYCMTLYQKSIKSEYARKIDDYFTRFGYATNLVKVPNLKGRSYFNYIQIANSENIGYPFNDIGVPATSMEQINNICRTGVTIWHDYINFGNYQVDNSIVTNN